MARDPRTRATGHRALGGAVPGADAETVSGCGSDASARDGAASRGPFRRRLSTSDPERAAQEIRDGFHVEHRLSIDGDTVGFAFSIETAGAGGFAVNRTRHTMRVGYDAQPFDRVIAVNAVRTGRLGFVTAVFDEIRAGPGDLAMGPPHGTFRAVSEDLDAVPVVLDAEVVAAYAAATCGLDAVEFTGLGPISPRMARHWTSTVHHVRDDVLGNPVIAECPIVVDSSMQMLCAALLSTFPNTALARACERERTGRRGDVSAAALREVVDLVDSHADRPIGPCDIADLAGLPARDVVDGLRRHHGTDPARLLWHARLHGVRRALRDADPQHGPAVSVLAARWGFTRLGRFRVAYHHAFGEPPEQTLRA